MRFLEHANVYGNYYGTPKSFVEKQLLRGNDVLLEIDVQGALEAKRSVSGRCVCFFGTPVDAGT